MTKIKLLLVVAFSVILSLFNLNKASAADFEYKISSTYDLQSSGDVSVRVVVDVTNKVSAPTPSSIVLPLPEVANNVAANYQDGGSITTNYNAQNKSLRLETTNDYSGLNRKWSVVVNYTSNLSKNYGDTLIMSIKPLNYQIINVVSESVSLAADLQLGVAIPKGPAPDQSIISAGQQISTWANEKGSLKDAVGILFGDTAVAEVTIESSLENTSWWWQTKTITLPPDTNQQRVFLDSVNPKPSNIRLDLDGNILAEFRLRPRQSINVTARATIVVYNYSYDLDEDSTPTDSPLDIIERYTSNEDWPSDNYELPATTDPAASAIIEAIVDSVAKQQFDQPQPYEKSLTAANQLIGRLRESNIPARLVLGHVFGDGGGLFDKSRAAAWVEAYSAGTGWISLDPIFEQKGDYYGTTDVQRVGLVLRGFEKDFPPEQLENTQVSYSKLEIPSTPDMIPTISSTKTVFLPGLSIESTKIDFPKGVIVDNTGLLIANNSVVKLGSIAPLQTVQLRNFRFGGAAFSSEEISYGLLTGSTIDEALVKTRTSVNYLPMLIVLGFAIVGFIVWIIWRKIKPKKQKHKRTRDAVVFATESSGEAIEQHDLLPKTPAKEEQLPEENQKPPETETKETVEPIKEGRSQATEKLTNDTITPTETKVETKPHRRPRRRLIQ